ncbi:MAG: glycosyltransferase family 2 protein [Microthrixaceae bacterium]
MIGSEPIASTMVHTLAAIEATVFLARRCRKEIGLLTQTPRARGRRAIASPQRSLPRAIGGVDHMQQSVPNVGPSRATPTVSVVVPTLNERGYIRDCLDSLVGQGYPGLIEVLVCDGGSTDGTRDLVAAYGGIVRLVDNLGVTAAAALNLGLRESRGEVLVRGDAHALYAADYVERCVEILAETDAANVGGPMRAVGTTSFGRAVAAVTSSPFGIGPGRFHYATERSEVDTVYLGCWRRTTLERLGGWDEDDLQWGAEDHELNMRLRAEGGRIVLDPAIRSWYFPRDNPRSLARQYFNYGMGKASTLAKHTTLPSWRPLAPAVLVLLSAVGLIFGRGGWRLGLPAVHAAVCGAVALRLGTAPGIAPQRAFAAVELCHWSYGAGFWTGSGRVILGRGFVKRPGGHR